MPLAFESRSHGTVAFGFFNIYSDMLLLDRYFFFASDFSSWLVDAAGSEDDAFASSREVWTIDAPEDVGDLMGAIHGVRHVGFIGETYLRYPFPERREDFKQRPEGRETDDEFAEMIGPFARRIPITVRCDRPSDEVSIGDYRFGRAVFGDLVSYVHEGGYPRWRDSQRPPHVLEMAAAVRGSALWLFEGMAL